MLQVSNGFSVHFLSTPEVNSYTSWKFTTVKGSYYT